MQVKTIPMYIGHFLKANIWDTVRFSIRDRLESLHLAAIRSMRGFMDDYDLYGGYTISVHDGEVAVDYLLPWDIEVEDDFGMLKFSYLVKYDANNIASMETAPSLQDGENLYDYRERLKALGYEEVYVAVNQFASYAVRGQFKFNLNKKTIIDSSMQIVVKGNTSGSVIELKNAKREKKDK